VVTGRVAEARTLETHPTHWKDTAMKKLSITSRIIAFLGFSIPLALPAIALAF